MRCQSLFLIIAGAICFFMVFPDYIAAGGQRIQFSGYEWEVKSGRDHPGPNEWDSRNVWVDEAGRLHLKISEKDGKWYCAELFTRQSFYPGRFEFRVEGPVDHLDRFIVLGLFLYPDPQTGPGEENEVDIEFAHWGEAKNSAGSYTVKGISHPYHFLLADNSTTHIIAWRKQNIDFESYYGFDSSDIQMLYSNWTFSPSEYRGIFPVAPLRVHLNLWLFRGHPPANGQTQEIIIHSVTYTPF